MIGVAEEPRPTLLRCVLVFGIFGPPIGWLIAFLQLALRQSESLDHSGLRAIADSVATLGIMSVIGIPVAYALGIAPALLTALAHWSVRQHFNVVPSIVATATVGTLLALLAATIMWLGGSVELEELSQWPYYLLPGAVAAVSCGLLAESRRTKEHRVGA